MRKGLGFFFLLFFFLLLGCDTKEDVIEDNGLEEVVLPVIRFDELLYQENLSLVKNQVKGLFLKDFTHMIQVPNHTDSLLFLGLDRYRKDKYVEDVHQTVGVVFSDFTPYESLFRKAFTRYHHYFPNKMVPAIITYVSAFNYAIAVDSTYLGIGLDMFLGDTCSYYPRLGFPLYKSRNMTPDHLVSSALSGWCSTEFEYSSQKQADLLSEMIYQGKLLYLQEKLLPHTADNILIGYSVEQLEWCENNAQDIWVHFVDNGMLFESDTQKMMSYMQEGPFTKGFPEGSPGKIGHWVGWQIVRAYMRNGDSIHELMSNTLPGEAFLKKAKYKP